MVLPKKFAENITEKFREKVSLIGPSTSIWDVDLIKKADSIEFGGDGWKQFVKANDLKQKDLLVFKYTKNLSFEVLIFDPESCCEKEASYFVKHCRNQEYEKNKTPTEAPSIEVVENGDNDDDEHNDSELVVTKKSKTDVNEVLGRRQGPQTRRKSLLAGYTRAKGTAKKKLGSRELHSKSKVNSENEAEGNDTTKEQTRVSERKQNTPENGASVVNTAQTHKPTKRKRVLTGSSRKPAFENENEAEGNELVHDLIEDEPEENGASKKLSPGSQREQNTLADTLDVLETADFHKSTEKKGTPKKLQIAQSDSAEKTYVSSYKSNRRKVTKTEKDNAYQSASDKLTEMGFISVMRRSAVYTKFCLNIPTCWVREHIHCQNQEVVLRVGEKTWLAVFYYSGMKRGGGFGGTGWKKFALDNFLEEFDVCIFEPIDNEDDNKVILDVEIFRVIPDIIPPTPTTRSKKA